ncbi:MAG: metallophosphoesterase family protein [Polyangiaceae bacterium]
MEARAKRPARRGLVHALREIHCGPEGLTIVAVADTHGRPHPGLGARIDEVVPSLIVHAGDVGCSSVLRDLEARAPVIAVRGNIDGRDLPDFATVDIRNDQGTLLKILLTHVAVYGPRLRSDVARIARMEDASLVVCGHSHVPFAAREGGITVFNPGSAGPRRFRLPIVLGVIEVRPNGASVGHIDCETGRAWSP